MKVPLEWLKDYVAVRLAPEALAQRLTMAGLEVTALEEGTHGVIFDIEVTPNRADCLSMIGIAREVAAIAGQRVRLLPRCASRDTRHGRLKPSRPLAPRPSIRIEDRHGCMRYIGRLITGVAIAPSPVWMQQRLLACGARPINNVVDITNYVLLEYGQPLHAFDFERLANGAIVIRRAQADEPITTLDGVARALPAETLVVADGHGAVAVAGIMGGVGSEVTERTRTVLLESALFDSVTIRRTARRLGLSSESSYRFERGVDPVGVETASDRAAQLISELAGGTLREVIDRGTKPARRTVVSLEPARLERWLGTRVQPSMLRTTLARLSCHVASSGSGSSLRVDVPSFRRDLAQEVDLYEEIARLIGYDRLPARTTGAPWSAIRTETAALYRRLQSLTGFCASLGLQETLSWSLVSESDLARFGFSAAQAARLTNPLSQEHAYIRASLLMGLLQTVRRNVSQGAISIRVFEVGRVVPPGQSTESVQLGIALSGLWARDWQTTLPCDFFRLKGLLQTLTGRLCTGALELQAAQLPWAAPGQATQLTLGGRPLGVAGQVAGALAAQLDIEQGVWLAELSVGALMAAARAGSSIHAPRLFPPVKRDLSIVVDDCTPFAALNASIRQTAGALADRIELVDRYTGPPVPKNKHSLTFSIEYRETTRTLTADEADALHQRICDTLAERFGATRR